MAIFTPPQPPPDFVATSRSIILDAEEIIAKIQELHSSLVQSVEPSSATFENVMVPLGNAENALVTSYRLLVFYKSISTDARVREASAQAKSLIDAFKLEMSMDEPLFKLVDIVKQNQEGLVDLDPESRRFLEKVHHDHTANGLSLPAGSAERERFKAIKKQISELESKFLKTLAESKSNDGGICFTREQLAGMPENFLARLEKSGPGQGDDTLRVSFNNADFFPILRYAEDAETRRRMFVAGESICAASVPIFKEAVLLRDEAARLLGYPNHAAFKTRDKMAKDPETVNTFLADLRTGIRSLASDELQQKKDLKRQDVETRGGAKDDRYFLWDDSFYNNLALKKRHSADQQLLSEYFALDVIKPVMLEMMQSLFGFRFVEIIGSERAGKIWHEDAELYGLDLFVREDKPGHGCSFNLVPGIPGQYPATALLLSFSKPVSQQPTLLRHDEVVLFFHELGHCIHDLASKAMYARFHGPEGTAVDFSEAPSQLLEYWFWTPSVLRAIGQHYSYLNPEYLQTWKEKAGKDQEQPPKALPETMIENLVASKNTSAVLINLRQLTISLFDMAVHAPLTSEDLDSMNVSSIYNSIRRDVCQLNDPTDLGEKSDWGHGFAIYPHLMDDYDAGFYSYLFSKVFAADIFYTVFAEDPMNTKESLRYRRAVLEKGGVQGELQTLTEYLGREPKVDPFYQEMGLSLEDGEGRILVEKLSSGTIEAQHVGYDEEVDEGAPDVTARPLPWRRTTTLLVLLSFSFFFLGYLGGQFKRSHSQPAVRARKCESIATRREWRTLSRQEKSDFIDAVTCLASAPSKQIPDDSLYDDFAYWDWTLDWEDLPASPVFSNTSGFGGIDGIRNNPCVTDGPLANLHLPYYGKEHPNCIWRALPTPENAHQPNQEVLSIDQMSPSMVETLLAQETYDGFLAQLQTGPRISIPNGIAGDFIEFTAPNDPLFFLHHR
ncbi:metallopeptidase [Seiridium cupressi]